MIRKIISIFLFLVPHLVYGGVAFEGENVAELFHDQDIEESLRKAKSGDMRAQYLLGAAYLYGLEEQDVEASPTKGIFWLKKSADQGVAEAFSELARVYHKGIGVEKNKEKWVDYLSKAAEGGVKYRQLEIMDLYRYGDPQMGVEKNEKKHLYWLRKTAESGATISMIDLALRYREGRGLEKNNDAALKWMMKAAEKNDGMAKSYAAEFYEKGIGTEKDFVRAYMLYDLSNNIGREAKQELAKKMTNDQIKEAIARSWQWQMERGVVHPSSEGYRYRYPLEESD